MKLRLGFFRFVIGFCALFACVMAPHIARAQSDEELARTLFKQGLDLHEQHRYDEALKKYREAYARWNNPKILANIGTAAWELGRYWEAAEAYDRFLAEAPADAPNRPEVERALEQVQPKVGTLQVDLGNTAGRLTVAGRTIDTRHADRIRVDPGPSTLEFAPQGGSPIKRSVDVPAGGTVRVSFAPGASTGPDVGQPTTASPTSPRTDQRTRKPVNVVPWIIGGVGVASLIVSGTFYLQHRSAVDDLDSHCINRVCPDWEQATIDRANQNGTISLIALGIGALGVGTAVWMLTGQRSERSTGAARLGVMVSGGPRSAGAAARLEF